MDAAIGPAVQESKLDIVCNPGSAHYRNMGLLVCELQETSFCPLEGLGKAFVSTVNLVILQRQVGLKPEEVAVPLVLSTGNLMQFAWATTLNLNQLFPVLHVTSRVLDVSFPPNLCKASKALARAMLCRESRRGACSCGVNKMKLFPSQGCLP
jgi:hypothetical protein